MSTTDTQAPPPAEPPQPGPRASRDEVRDLGRIRRTTGADRKVAGVAGGLARHLDIDPVILRVALVVLVFFGGSGLLLYAACWLLLPEDGSPRTPLGLDDRSRTVALVVIGVVSGLLLLGDSIGQIHFPWVLVPLAAVALVVLLFLDRDRGPRPTAPPVPHQPDPHTGELVPAPTPHWAPPTVPAYAAPTRNPRRRGPILFWFTLALATLAVAVLGVLDLAGLDVAPAAYPATVVAACGVMLLVGAFYGRGGGLILIGLAASVVMGGTAAVSTFDPSDVRLTPTSAAAVDSRTTAEAGEIVLDLTDVADPAALLGRTLELEASVGRIEVILPAGLSTQVDARVEAAGNIELFGSQRGGFDLTQSRHGPATGAPALTIDAQVGVGEISVHTEESR